MGYTDNPDGKECFQKIWACTKYSGMLGLVVSTYDVLMYTKPQGYVPTLGAYIRSTVPLAGAGAVFAAVTCASTSLRGKDDKLNYFLGGKLSRWHYRCSCPKLPRWSAHRLPAGCVRHHLQGLEGLRLEALP
ncbi:NADH dehydrogenase [ubiquinone] 1 alpha subcomplex subunit 11-like [Penaeus chinensis]|uniref:NADH dehydrogenase [ubiquinone] 1 alpha subcomplex subunit 11-like n=1 Tax=Penaeus chinensis TaxID=139456 RepID=UPI001FB8086A|nr:NADH dehydrogenase [ubiquinone] 1 alpha subcomplex subunit 11-like [Penaeus chinensis]